MIVRINSTAVLYGVVQLAGSGATLKAYTAPMPSTGGDPVGSAVLLGTVSLGDPMGTVDGSTLTFAASTPDFSIDETGSIAWVRIANGATWVADLDVTVDTDIPVGAVTMDTNTAVQQGGILSLASSTISV